METNAICNCFDSDNQGCNPEPCPIHPSEPEYIPDEEPWSDSDTAREMWRGKGAQ